MRISDWSSDVCSSDLIGCSRLRSRLLLRLRGDRAVIKSVTFDCYDTLVAYTAGKHAAIRAIVVEQGAAEKGGDEAQAEAVKNGRAHCRERVSQYVGVSVVGDCFKKKSVSKIRDIN